MDEREDSGGSSDAKGQRQHGGERENWREPHLTESVGDILP
jgi:hypothetical protein